jgi:hypothetical protein
VHLQCEAPARKEQTAAGDAPSGNIDLICGAATTPEGGNPLDCPATSTCALDCDSIGNTVIPVTALHIARLQRRSPIAKDATSSRVAVRVASHVHQM